MLYRLCRCGVPIPQTRRLCPSCAEKQERREKFNRPGVSRHMKYNREKRSAEAYAFYCSRAWKELRLYMIGLFDGIDIVALYERNQILPADRVHHIEELEEAWEKRLDPMNLLPMNHATHTRITAEYKAGKESMEACQRRLIGYRNRWFADRGGIEKVLALGYSRTPPFSTEKTPHGKI